MSDEVKSNSPPLNAKVHFKQNCDKVKAHFTALSNRTGLPRPLLLRNGNGLLAIRKVKSTNPRARTFTIKKKYKPKRRIYRGRRKFRKKRRYN